jgi:hypothetical protein
MKLLTATALALVIGIGSAMAASSNSSGNSGSSGATTGTGTSGTSGSGSSDWSGIDLSKAGSTAADQKKFFQQQSQADQQQIKIACHKVVAMKAVDPNSTDTTGATGSSSSSSGKSGSAANTDSNMSSDATGLPSGMTLVEVTTFCSNIQP